MNLTRVQGHVILQRSARRHRLAERVRSKVICIRRCNPAGVAFDAFVVATGASVLRQTRSVRLIRTVDEPSDFLSNHSVVVMLITDESRVKNSKTNELNMSANEILTILYRIKLNKFLFKRLRSVN